MDFDLRGLAGPAVGTLFPSGKSRKGDETGIEYKTYLWEHFKFNADQRLRAFNFFVVFAVFANGGVFTALEKDAHPVIILIIGAFAFLLALK